MSLNSDFERHNPKLTVAAEMTADCVAEEKTRSSAHERLEDDVQALMPLVTQRASVLLARTSPKMSGDEKLCLCALLPWLLVTPVPEDGACEDLL